MKRLALMLFLSASTFASAEWNNLWPAGAPGAAKPPSGTEESGEGGRLGNIEVPQYELYQANKRKANGAAVVIFPGGGYGMLAAGHEGKEYAEWLNERGITAIVVKYRVTSNPALGYQFPVPFLDARRAIRTVRANASKWGVDPSKVGVMGSSAGGHLASLTATRFKDTFPEEGKDETDKQDCRPDFAILIYPVISMKKPLTHDGSHKNLLGENPPADKEEAYSTELQVSSATPPVFLLTTADDWVDCRNSLVFATACKEHNVPLSLHLFEKGGHGYGLKGTGPLDQWPSLLDRWLAERFPAK